jgi:hypothetical protein
VFLTFFSVKSADPAGSGIVFPVLTEHVVNLIDQAQRKPQVFLIPRSVAEFQEVANGESIGPQVAAWFSIR